MELMLAPGFRISPVLLAAIMADAVMVGTEKLDTHLAARRDYDATLNEPGSSREDVQAARNRCDASRAVMTAASHYGTVVTMLVEHAHPESKGEAIKTVARAIMRDDRFLDLLQRARDMADAYEIYVNEPSQAHFATWKDATAAYEKAERKAGREALEGVGAAGQ